MFVTAEANANVGFRRAIERRALRMADDAAREMPDLPSEDALQPVHLLRRAAQRRLSRPRDGGLVRYLTEGSGRLRDVAKVTVSMAMHQRHGGPGYTSKTGTS